RNQDLRAARSAVDAARGRLEQAGLWPNPRLVLSNDTGGPFNNAGEYTRSLGISQDFPIAGRIGRAQDVARVDVARALAEVNEAERQLLGEVAASFYGVVTLDQQIKLRDRLIGIDESLVSTTQARQKAGEVSELDVNAAKLELERLRQERTVLTGERTATLAGLAALMGLPPSATPTLESTPPPVTSLPSLTHLITQALNERPDLRLLALTADRAHAERALANSSAWEDWNLSLGVQQDRRVIAGAPSQPADKALMLSLSIPLPLFNRNQGAIAAATANEESARDQLAALRLRIENRLAGEYAQVTRLLTALDAYTQDTLPLSRRNADLARNAYRQGQVSIVEVIQAERQENELNTAYTDALGQYLQALAALNTTTATWAPLMTHPVESSTGQFGDH
ncbi:MAG: TolC family protein, partial [Alphaproteobacteria bacterium]|nr:TolC family protein [Alphaproteobacteria bacterium]